MYAYGPTSRRNIAECHLEIQRLCYEVIKGWDCTALDGRRSKAEQVQNVANRVSKTMNSRHLPQIDGTSWAVDLAPYPVKWNDPSPKVRAAYERECLFFGGYVLGIADRMGINIRYGGDWDSDHDLTDQNFNDLVHYERKP